MRKWVFVVLGLLLFAGAAGTFAYRQMQPSVEPATASRDLARPRAGEKDAFERYKPISAERDGGWRLVELTLDLLNIVVGMVGIALAIMGGRMRREAIAMQSAQTKSTSNT